jgi:4-hydroxybenzoate polyprenyltransferase
MTHALGRRARGLLSASHPFPVAMVVSLTALLGVVSARGDLEAAALSLTVAAMLFSQLAIGWSNDFLDREHDAFYQPDKPVALGLVEPRLLMGGTAVALAVSFAAGALLGVVAVALLFVGTSMGFLYNLWLKDTRFSWLPYVAGFAVLPPFVWASLDAFHARFWALYPIGVPLVLAVHLANALPDVYTDRTAGRRGLAALLGRRGSLLLLAVCLLAAPAIIAATLLWMAYDPSILLAASFFYAVLALIAAAVYLRRPDMAGADLAFRLIAPASLVLAIGWLAAVET